MLKHRIKTLVILLFGLSLSGQEDERCYWIEDGSSERTTIDSSITNLVYVLDAPNRIEWRRQRVSFGLSSDPKDSKVWCRITLPRTYRLHPIHVPSSELKEALCPDEVSEDIIKQIQTELEWEGMYEGEISGVWDRKTEKAMTEFQERHDLTTGYMLVETIHAL